MSQNARERRPTKMEMQQPLTLGGPVCPSPVRSTLGRDEQSGGLAHLRLAWRHWVERCWRDDRPAPDYPRFRERMAQADYIRTFSHDAWCTPTFAREVCQGYAWRKLMRWLRHQGRRTYAVLCLERGPSGLLLHPHLLVGGLARSSPKHPTPEAMTRLRDSWQHGNIEVEPYHAGIDRPGTTRGASWYVVKTGFDAVTIVGQPIVYRPRRRVPIRPDMTLWT